jgi:hypothetical protein
MAPQALESPARGWIFPQRPAYQAYKILHLGFIALPILAGADKFMGALVNWEQYLAPAFLRFSPVDAHTFMLGVGAVEILAGILVAVKPRIGGLVVAAWLWGIIANLLLIPGFYDIALRDFGLSLGALALARLAAGMEMVVRSTDAEVEDELDEERVRRLEEPLSAHR